MPDEMKADRDIALAAVRNDGAALQFVSDDFRNDRGIVLEAIRRSEWALWYMPTAMRADREVAIEAISSFAHWARATGQNVLAAAPQWLEMLDSSLKTDNAVVVTLLLRYPDLAPLWADPATLARVSVRPRGSAAAFVDMAQ